MTQKKKTAPAKEFTATITKMESPRYPGKLVDGTNMLRMPVQFGPIKATVFGGPFRDYVPGQRRLVSVKMAEEINHPHDISVPTEDFSVPSMKDMHDGIAKALQAILDGNDLYVGCMGGTGRTGLFMACLAKVMDAFNGQELNMAETRKFHTEIPAVAYVRKHYKPHAVETAEQMRYVLNFDTSVHVRELADKLVPAPREVIREVEKVVEVEKKVYLWNPLKALGHWLDQRTRP